MPFLPVLLATDVLLWLLVGAAAAYAWYCSRQEHLAAQWARVFRNPSAIASAVVLAVYILIGLADSLHYHPALQRQQGQPVTYSVEVRSVLDVAASHLRERAE